MKKGNIEKEIEALRKRVEALERERITYSESVEDKLLLEEYLFGKEGENGKRY